MNDWNRQIEAYREFFGTAEIRSKYGCVDGLSVFSHVLIAYSKASWSGVPVYEMLGVVNGQNSDLPLFLSEFWLLSELDILEHLDTMNEVTEIVEQGFEITDSSAIKPYIWTHSGFLSQWMVLARFCVWIMFLEAQALKVRLLKCGMTLTKNCYSQTRYQNF